MGSSTEFGAWGPAANRGIWSACPAPSGGSAAAVAAYQVPLSDRHGHRHDASTAALTGIVGMKPTYGRVSRYGIVAFASSLDQIGPLGRDVRDAALLLAADNRRRVGAEAVDVDDLLVDSVRLAIVVESAWPACDWWLP